MSIRLRLTLWYVGLLALVLAIFALGVYGLASYVLMQEIDTSLQERGWEVQTLLEGALPADGTAPPLLVFPETLELAPGEDFPVPSTFIQVLGTTGGDVEVMLTSGNLGAEHLPASSRTLATVAQGRGVLETVRIGTTPLRLLSLPVFLDEQPVGVVQVARSLAEERRTRASLALLLVGASGVALLMAGGIGLLLAGKALQPIDDITRTALAITRTQDLARRLGRTKHRDELGRLSATFNEMLDRIEELFQQQRGFTADISHELRTPLTLIRGNLDLLRRGGIRDEEALGAIGAEAERMARLVDDLLLLAELDSGIAVERRPVELDGLLWEVYRHAKTLAQGVEVSLVHEDQAEVLGDREWLRQMLLNLVSNALKYTPAGGKVSLALYREDGWVRLVVADTGIGIPEEDLPRLFERFYRVDKARSREQGGTGLGLAIVKWIAEAHGGRVEVKSTAKVGSTFTVLLPLG